MALDRKLAKLLNQSALEPQEGGRIILEETDPNSKMKVALENLPVPILAVRVEKLSHLALKEGPWNQKCDYLLFFASNDTDHVIFVELEKTLGNKRKSKEQLRRSLPFLEYLRSVCDVEHGLETPQSRVSIGYFLIGEKLSPRLDKHSVRVGPDWILKPEEHKAIIVNTVIGRRVSFVKLARA